MRARRLSLALATTVVALGLVAPAAAAAVPSPSAPTAAAQPSAARAARAADPAPGSGSASASAAVTSTGAPTTATTSVSSSPAAGSASSGGAAGSAGSAATAPPCTTNAGAPYPVICLPADSGENGIGYVPAGEGIEFAAQVVNDGATASDAKIVIQLPASLEVDPEDPPVRIDDWYPLDQDEQDGTPLHCTQNANGTTVVCATGTLAAGANVLLGIPLYADPNAPDGSRATFSVTLQPAGTSAFTPTSVSATVQFLGASHLKVTLDPTRLQVVVAHTGRVDARIVNLGPSAAIGTLGLAIIPAESAGGQHFLITNSPVDIGDLLGGLSSGEQARRAQLTATLLGEALSAAHRAARSSSSSHPSPVGFWPIGTIANGQTVDVAVEVKAESVGSNDLQFGVLSETDPGHCNADGTVCDEIASARLVAVAAQPPLAATGVAAGAGAVWLALALIAAGSILLAVTRRGVARRA